jgi:hypothetical protein
MTKQQDIWNCSECGNPQGRHDMWFEGDVCGECNSETAFTIRKLYQEIQDELDVWYGSLSFSQLEKVHNLNKNDLFGRGESETEQMLGELEDEWVEWSTDTKVMWYNDLMGY